MKCKPGDVVLVQFPFTDLSRRKLRPGLVLSPASYGDLHDDVVVLAMTTQPQLDSGLALTRWQAAGLPKETWLKPLMVTLSSALVVRAIGSIESEDLPAVRTALHQMIAPEFF